MITVTYKNDETNQTMLATFREGTEPDTCKVNIDFEPSINDNTKDPFGIMNALFNALKLGE